MEIRDVRWHILRRIPKKIGEVFFINGKAYRRGCGILLASGTGIDPTVNGAFWRREKRRRAKRAKREAYLRKLSSKNGGKA